MAWVPEVRAFLRAARRELDWKNSTIDRTLMAFIALHMQQYFGQNLGHPVSDGAIVTKVLVIGAGFFQALLLG